MEEYLPPIVTKLKADISDLMAGFAAARAEAKAFAQGMKDDVSAALRHAGKAGSDAFVLEMKNNLKPAFENFDTDVGEKLIPEVDDLMDRAGKAGGKSLAESLKGVLMPAVIGLVLLLTPMLVTGISSAITLGIGAGFIGLGIFLLREQQGLIDAATHFKNTVSAVFKDAALPMLGPLISALGILSALVVELGPSFKEIFAALAPAIVPLANGIAGMIREMMPGLKELAPVAAQLLITVGEVLPVIGEGLGALFSSMAANGPAMISFIRESGHWLASALKFLGDFFTLMGDVYLKMLAFRDLARSGGWDTPWNAISTAAKIAWGWIKTAAGAVAGFFVMLGTGIADWATRTWNDITGWVSRTTGAIGAWFVRVGTWFDELPGKLATAAGAAFDGFFYAIGSGMAQAFMFLVTFKTNLITWASETLIGLVNWGASVKAAIILKITEMVMAIPGLLSTAYNATVSWATNTYNSVILWIARTVTEVGDWLGKIPGFILLKGQEAKERILNFFKDAGSWLKNFGKNMIQGLVDGFMGAVDGAVGMVKRAMDRIKQGAKDALGISSPSTVFAEMGMFSMKGFIQGLLGEQGSLRRAFNVLIPSGGDLGGLALSAAGGGAGGAGPRDFGGGSGGGPAMVHTTINIDGTAVVDAITPAAQQKKGRTGTTGLS